MLSTKKAKVLVYSVECSKDNFHSHSVVTVPPNDKHSFYDKKSGHHYYSSIEGANIAAYVYLLREGYDVRIIPRLVDEAD